MNSGALPPPPRSLPLLTAAERRAVLGGTSRGPAQPRELYDTLLGVAPDLVLTRPQVTDDEARVGSPLYPGPWEPREMAVLSKPDPAWLRSPAVRAALEGLGAAVPAYGDGKLTVPLPSRAFRQPGRHGPGLPLPLSAGNHLKAQGTAGDRVGSGPPGAGRPAA